MIKVNTVRVRRGMIAITATLVLAAGFLTNPQSGAEAGVTEGSGVSFETDTKPTPPDETVVIQRFEHSLSLGDALRFVSDQDIEARGFRIENDEIVSEYWPSDSLTPAQYLEWFDDLYGTAPQVAGILTEVKNEIVQAPPAEGGSDSKGTPEALPVPVETPPNLSVSAPEFLAPDPGDGSAWDRFDGSAVEGANAEALPAIELASSQAVFFEKGSSNAVPAAVDTARQRWFPDAMEYRIERWNSRQHFYIFANWGNGSSARARPQSVVSNRGGSWTVDYGMEFEVNLRNDEIGGVIRPLCPDGYRNEFIALNTGYTWGVTLGRDSYAGSLGAYADTNDVADECGKQSMAIGLSKPWNMPRNSAGVEQILISINAPVGNAGSSRITAGVQLVDDRSCQVYPNASLTDCMGDSLIAPQDAEAGRPALSETRKWEAAPFRCWMSLNHGDSTPTISVLKAPWHGCYVG